MEERRRQSGFTFVEILVVVAILAIVTTGIIVVASSVHKQAKINATEGIIQNLVGALQEYKNYHEANFNGFDQLATSDTWIESLYKVPNAKKILDNIPSDLKANLINPDNQIVDTIYDPWGKQIEIEFNEMGTFPTIRSSGPDEEMDTADDIINDTIRM